MSQQPSNLAAQQGRLRLAAHPPIRPLNPAGSARKGSGCRSAQPASDQRTSLVGRRAQETGSPARICSISRAAAAKAPSFRMPNAHGGLHSSGRGLAGLRTLGLCAVRLASHPAAPSSPSTHRSRTSLRQPAPGSKPTVGSRSAHAVTCLTTVARPPVFPPRPLIAACPLVLLQVSVIPVRACHPPRPAASPSAPLPDPARALSGRYLGI